MSMTFGTGPNPFEVASRFIGKKYQEGARSRRDAEQHNLTQQTLAMHSAHFAATMAQTEQQASIAAKAEKSKTKRAAGFAQTIHGFAQPGTQVSMQHDNISASYTKAHPTPFASTTPTKGRVPVKKVRGGKKPL